MKITIIGSSGGGKSTLSRKISKKFNIPRMEIDRIWFKYDGHKFINGTVEEKALVSNKVHDEIEVFLTENHNWVCDGTYSKIQPVIATQADVVVLIKRSLINRIVSHLVRVLKGDDRHPEVTKLQDLHFVKTIIKRWWKNEDKNLQEFLKPFGEKLVVLRSFKDIDNYFKSLERIN